MWTSLNVWWAPRRECVVCLDRKPSKQFHAKAPASACTNPVNVCKQCISDHIEEMNQKGEIMKIRCPCCRLVLEFNDVKQGASQRGFERYDTLLLRRELQSIPDFCWCKNAQCGSGQICDDGFDHPKMKCQGCEELSCFRHDLPWHDNQTCEEVDASLNDIASGAYMEKRTKLCPHCRKRIEKNGGCNHVTCHPTIGCGHTFCWLS